MRPKLGDSMVKFKISIFLSLAWINLSYAAANCPQGTTLDVDCWSCGANCTAYITTLKNAQGEDLSFDSGEPQQKLTITGTGQMTNYSLTQDTDYGHDYGSTAPWDKFFNTVKEIDVSGVTNISNGAFRHFLKATDVTLSDTVLSVGLASFDYLPSLQNLKMSDNLTTIDGYAFSYTPLRNFVMPDSVKSVSEAAFREANISKMYCSTEQMSLCTEILEARGYTDEQIASKLKLYETTGGEYFYNGKFYQSPNDIGTPNHIKKRIYTIDEANKASGKTNTVTIRYR